jgi:ribosomal protein S18 acetylase RimI-like enzyme
VSEKIQVSEIKNEFEIPALPDGLSSFSVPYLQYWAKEALEIGGIVQVSKTPGGQISGLFVYDNYEENGTVFAKSREVFDYYYKLKPFSSLWAELQTENPCYQYDILSMDLDDVEFKHRFKHEVVIERRTLEIERFMSLTVHYALNPKWVRVALANGDRCFVVRVGSEIAGIAWLSLVDGIGRVPDLYVKPQFRRTGIALDLFFARLIYLQSMHARSYFAEIAHDNEAALKHATKVGMKVSGQIFEYNNEHPSNAKSGLG